MDLKSEFLGDYPIVIKIPVAWGEMDAFGHVNNIIYFRYFESARLAYFEAMGYLKSASEHGIGPILASTQCKFKLPVTYPDNVLAGTRVREMSADRFVMDYRVVSQNHHRIAADGEGLIVSYNYLEGAKTPIPEDIWTGIEKLEGKSFPKPSA